MADNSWRLSAKRRQRKHSAAHPTLRGTKLHRDLTTADQSHMPTPLAVEPRNSRRRRFGRHSGMTIFRSRTAGQSRHPFPRRTRNARCRSDLRCEKSFAACAHGRTTVRVINRRNLVSPVHEVESRSGERPTCCPSRRCSCRAYDQGCRRGYYEGTRNDPYLVLSCLRNFRVISWTCVRR